MNEWTIVGVLAALVALFLSVGKPVINLNNSITALTETIKHLRERQNEAENKNTAAHARIWKHNEEQDEQISEHAVRLHDLDGK